MVVVILVVVAVVVVVVVVILVDVVLLLENALGAASNFDVGAIVSVDSYAHFPVVLFLIFGF